MLKFAVLAAVCFTVLQEGSALQCYICTSACDVAHATLSTECGTHASPSVEAFCVTQQRKGAPKEEADMKIRRCVLADKGKKPECPQDFNCDNCQTDKCNSATSIFASTFTLAGVLLSYVLAKYILH